MSTTDIDYLIEYFTNMIKYVWANGLLDPWSCIAMLVLLLPLSIAITLSVFVILVFRAVVFLYGNKPVAVVQMLQFQSHRLKNSPTLSRFSPPSLYVAQPASGR